MIRVSMTLLAVCILLGALASTGLAQPPPAPAADTTKAAALADSSAAPAPTPVPATAPATPTGTMATPATPAASAPVPPPPAPPSPPSATTASTQATPPKPESRIYYGGTVGFTFFGDVTRFYVQPVVGYKLTPRLSTGVKVGYEHLKDTRPQTDVTSDNWGAGVFGRFKLLPMVYAHVEYAFWSYDTGSNRESVPFLLLGAGYVKRLTPRMALTVEALFDVLQDEDSPYRAGEPWVSAGVGVGF